MNTAPLTNGKDQFKLSRSLQDIGDDDTPNLSEHWLSFDVQQQKQAKKTSGLCSSIASLLSQSQIIKLQCFTAQAPHSTVRNMHTESIKKEI